MYSAVRRGLCEGSRGRYPPTSPKSSPATSSRPVVRKPSHRSRVRSQASLPPPVHFPAAVRLKLADLGYMPEDLERMTPAEADTIIRRGIRA